MELSYNLKIIRYIQNNLCEYKNFCVGKTTQQITQIYNAFKKKIKNWDNRDGEIIKLSYDLEVINESQEQNLQVMEYLFY